MSLREEIAMLLAKSYCEAGVYATAEVYPVDKEVADELVNKALDAVEEAILSCDKYDAYLWNHNEIKAAINKLRDGK